MSYIQKQPWEVKYRPTHWQDLLLPKTPQIRGLLTELLTTGYFPKASILLVGDGGEGKTTFANALANITGWPVIELKESGEGKGSLESLDDMLRRTPGADKDNEYGSKWLVIGNEISQSTVTFREGLRAIIDKHGSRAFFVFTDNYPDKLYDQNPQVFSNERVKTIDWGDTDKAEIEAYCTKILDIEGIPATAERRDILKATLANAGKSIRKALSELEMNTYGLKTK